MAQSNAWFIPELVTEIMSHLSHFPADTVSIDDSKRSRRALARLAQASRQLRAPATRALWTTLPGIAPLLGLLSGCTYFSDEEMKFYWVSRATDAFVSYIGIHHH